MSWLFLKATALCQRAAAFPLPFACHSIVTPPCLKAAVWLTACQGGDSPLPIQQVLFRLGLGPASHYLEKLLGTREWQKGRGRQITGEIAALRAQREKEALYPLSREWYPLSRPDKCALGLPSSCVVVPMTATFRGGQNEGVEGQGGEEVIAQQTGPCPVA